MSIILITNNKEDLIIIPNEAIRVRVIANSNDIEDIKVKEIIKEDINKSVDKILENTNSIDLAREKINNNIKNIHNIVEKRLKELNYNKDFHINYGFNYFPEKEFKGINYKDGYYESLVITLGEGDGPNYWCVLYPPLCLIDDTKNIKEYRLFIKDILDKYMS